MNINLIFRGLFWTSLLIFYFSNCSSPFNEEQEDTSPNIIIIYADDLGVGDVSCYQRGTLQTPNIDRIAENGVLFQNGYASSATCTPSRYALLTGEYPWRNQKARILAGNAPLIIDTSMQTLPKMLRQSGYVTGVVGKWHLGLGLEGMDWNGEIRPGPLEVGFDACYILASTNDRVPTVYIENRAVVDLNPEDSLFVNYQENFEGELTGRDHPELLKLLPSHGHDMSIHNGISRIGYMKGGKSALWIDENMADTVLVKAIRFISDHQDRPFFLYYSLHQPHVPRTPHGRFAGKSGQGPRGDVILEADWAIGQLLDMLDSLGLSENTMIVFSSDNGPVLDDGYKDQAVEQIGNHTPSGGMRGGKYSLFEAGAHVPFMASWPGTIKPGKSNALICQMDLMNSFAQIVGSDIKSKDGEPLIDALLNRNMEGRDVLILEATGRKCIRKDDWVLIPPHEGPPMTNRWVNIETGNADEYQLYNLSTDHGQQINLAESNPEKIKQLSQLFLDLTNEAE